MIPVLSPQEMAEVDRAAPEPLEVLVARAGWAVAREARRFLGGVYGRRVVVLAGKGNNGADGRAAAAVLARAGAAVTIVEDRDRKRPLSHPRAPADLVIDAALGTGLARPYDPPDPGGAPVLAVDIPSGISGADGSGTAMQAVATVTFEAYKPGLFLGSGPQLVGQVHLAKIGLGALVAERARAWVPTDEDVFAMLPRRSRQSHKWETATLAVCGSPGMAGAAALSARSAMRAGAGYVLLGSPGSESFGLEGFWPPEPVSLRLPAGSWGPLASQAASRVKSVLVGPGLGAAAGGVGPEGEVARFLTQGPAARLPAVVDADGLSALGDLDVVSQVAERRQAGLILTPHDGEYRRLSGHLPPEDRLSEARRAAERSRAVVLLKGSPTVVAAPGGRALVVLSGSPRLATAGSGDVLSGVIAAFLARGLPPFEAAALAAHVHGRAAALGPVEGLVASDLPELIGDWLSAPPGLACQSEAPGSAVGPPRQSRAVRR